MTHGSGSLWGGALACAALLCVVAGCMADPDPLAFDARQYQERDVAVGDRTVRVRAYEGVVYVAKPVDAACQSLNLYVPVAYFEGGSVGGYSARTAPIFLPNMVGGYMPARPGGPGPDRSGRPNAIAHALVRGYVVASPGARGWPSRDGAGRFIGKAPAAIVDLKAAVRYLRHNDRSIPGDAEKIVSNGTSAGGALSALLGATGNSAAYAPYLQALGAADARDDIFAASCYCPITNLDNADGAYEWQFAGVNEYSGRGGQGNLTADQVEVSDRLRKLFPDYLNGLRLRATDGSVLALDAEGNGSFREHVKRLVVASAQKALDSGADLSALSWLAIEGKAVKDMDFAKYVRHIGRMKSPPAFDALDLRTPENGLFGTEAIGARHFTQFSRDRSPDHAMADGEQIRLMNPMGFIGKDGARSAAHWRIRHGTMDRDTSLAIPTMLALKLQNAGAQVDYAMPWGQAHGGDYDLPELFAWTDRVCR